MNTYKLIKVILLPTTAVPVQPTTMVEQMVIVLFMAVVMVYSKLKDD
jgi:hypothetical protein